MTAKPPTVALMPWSVSDFPLLVQANTASMTAFLGGPETGDQLLKRHIRYANPERHTQMFRIDGVEPGEPIGIIGFWGKKWLGEDIYETGWSVFPEFQGKGLAAAALRALLGKAEGSDAGRVVHAFPGVDNAASNALCRRVGFLLEGECELEYPPGESMFCNDWSFDHANAAFDPIQED